MLETKEQKGYLVTVVVLIIILSLVSLWHRPDLSYQAPSNVGSNNQPQVDAAAYLKYLESLKVDPAASKMLFQELLSEEDIKKEVVTALGVNQPVKPPEIAQASMKISNATGREAIVDYLTDTVGPIVVFNKNTLDLNKQLFDQNTSMADTVLKEEQNLWEKLTQVAVPKEAVALHKALLSSFESYDQLLRTAEDYAKGANPDPWPQVYQNYAAINLTTQIYNAEFKKLSEKYDLAALSLYYVESPPLAHSLFFKRADAFLGLGDVTITIGDIPRLIMDAVKEGLAASFSQFMGAMIQKLLAKIEQNYLIANFLYYSDALLTGQYVDDYLTKYVSDSLDRQIVKKFIPQFSCNQQNQDLKPIFKAKAAEYLGFDPSSINPNDPDYYQKMGRVGNFLSNPSGWETHFQALADQAKSEAEKAAEKELVSPGLKTPRDLVKLSIGMSISNIVSAQRAGFSAILQLGISNASSFVSKLVATLTQTLVNQFVFRGAVSNTGAIGVLKEQSTCLAAAQMQLVLPTADTVYQNPPPAPTREELEAEEELYQCMSDWDSLNVREKISCFDKINQRFSTCKSKPPYNANLCAEMQTFLQSHSKP